MTKNRSMRIAILVLALALLTSCFVGSTFAKYTSSASGTDSVTVAKWDIKVDGNQFAVANPTFSFDLFNTIKEADTTTTEEHVVAGKIAPGTGGSFSFVVKNDSEVDATYTLAFVVTNDGKTWDHDGDPSTDPESTGPVPLEYSTDGGTNWNTALSNKTGNLAKSGGSETVTVMWRWAIGTAGSDNAWGIAAQGEAPSVTVAGTLTVDQVD